jgi:hypothetical protein
MRYKPSREYKSCPGDVSPCRDPYRCSLNLLRRQLRIALHDAKDHAVNALPTVRAKFVNSRNGIVRPSRECRSSSEQGIDIWRWRAASTEARQNNNS